VPGFAEAVGLTDGMTGEQFEDRLGWFLRSVLAFRDVRSLLGPLGQMLRCNAPATAGGANQNDIWETWHDQAVFQIDQVLGRVYESLYESFGAPNYDPGLVRNAYANLLNQLGIDQHSQWVYATTPACVFRRRSATLTCRSVTDTVVPLVRRPQADCAAAARLGIQRKWCP
jgi:hypothetical protein